jgi:hypothetical protein
MLCLTRKQLTESTKPGVEPSSRIYVVQHIACYSRCWKSSPSTIRHAWHQEINDTARLVISLIYCSFLLVECLVISTLHFEYLYDRVSNFVCQINEKHLINFGFLVITQRVILVGRRFGTPCLFHTLGRSDRFDPEYETDKVIRHVDQQV